MGDSYIPTASFKLIKFEIFPVSFFLKYLLTSRHTLFTLLHLFGSDHVILLASITLNALTMHLLRFSVKQNVGLTK
jgi:hypothetical protein